MARSSKPQNLEASSSPQSYELLIQQYTLNYAARLSERLVARLLNCALIIYSMAMSGPSFMRLFVLGYIALFVNIFWYSENERRSKRLDAIEELFVRSRSIESSSESKSDIDEYVRGRYYDSYSPIHRVSRWEPLLWILFFVMALSTHFLKQPF
jgi:hypothetical protein